MFPAPTSLPCAPIGAMDALPQPLPLCVFCGKNSVPFPLRNPDASPTPPRVFACPAAPFTHAPPMRVLPLTARRFPALYRSVCRIALLTCATTAALTPLPAKTLIHVGSLIDGRADTPQKSVTLTIDGERITAVTPGYTAPAAGDTVIDLKNATVTPGWIDCHVHLDGQNSPTSYAERGTLNPGDYAL
eukprot:gene7220-9193_t